MYISASEAIQKINSDQKVFLHGSAATPIRLINELIAQKDRLFNVELISIPNRE